MAHWLDKRYINIVSPRLPLFKWKKPSLANFRCVFCGDSEKNKRKARGYLFAIKGTYSYKCHNCGMSLSLPSFLKQIAPEIYQQYQLETFKEKNHVIIHLPVLEIPKKPIFPKILLWEDLRINKLPDSHFAKQYILGRNVPEKFYNDILFVENYDEWVKQIIDPSQDTTHDACIVILIRNKEGIIIGANARSLTPKDNFSKYWKAKISADVKLIFGIERVDTSKKVYVFEGEFDSMFVDNAISVGGVNLMFNIEKELGVNKSNVVCVIDKDQRNREVIKAANSLIDDGYAVVLFPGSIEGKDMNDFVVKHKLSTEQIQELLEKNTYSGLNAKLKMTQWSKIK